MKELIVVMPVYNEETLIEPVLEAWVKELRRLRIDFSIQAYNDGSKDASLQRLKHCASLHREIVIVDKPNSGHGPTILFGYRSARSQWILQIDSDNEIPETEFAKIWNERDKADLIMGRRLKEQAPRSRRVLSWGARALTRWLYGAVIFDVNSCFRLYRVEKFQAAFAAIETNTFAPNVILTGYAALNGLRLFEIPVRYQNRVSGFSSIRNFKIIRIALIAFAQTVRARFVL